MPSRLEYIKSKLLFDAIAILSINVIVYSIYCGYLPSWWIGDDPFILKHAAQYSPWEYFLMPSIWQKLSANNLTPMVSLLYDFDLSLFGLAPSLFYLHHFISICLLVNVAYIFLRQWFPKVISFSSIVLFSLLPCFANNIFLLMPRHYVEGLTCTLISLLFYNHSLKVKKCTFAWIGAFFFILVVLCKEVYVPCILVIILWPDLKNIGLKNIFIKIYEKRFFILPFLLVVIAYIFYRRWMLGVWLGGYGSVYSTTFDIHILIKQLSYFVIGNSWWTLPFIAALFFIAFLFYKQNKIEISIFAFTIFVASTGPLLGVLTVFARRHLFLPSFVIIVALAFSLSVFWKHLKFGKIISLFFLFCLFIGIFLANREIINNLQELKNSYTIQGKFLWQTSDENDVLMVQGMPEWYIHSLFWLKQHYIKDGVNIEKSIERRSMLKQTMSSKAIQRKAIIDMCNKIYLQGSVPDKSKFWYYDSIQKTIKKIDKGIILAMQAKCIDYNNDAKLNIKFLKKGNKVSWQFGPYSKGYYFLADPETGAEFLLPHKGMVSVDLDNIMHDGKIYVCYKDQENWLVCSSVIPTIIKK